MTQRCQMLRWVLLAGLSANACQYDHDVVEPGYYAQDAGKAMTAAPPESTAQRAQGVAQAQSGGAMAGTGAVFAGPGESTPSQQGQQAGQAGAAASGAAQSPGSAATTSTTPADQQAGQTAGSSGAAEPGGQPATEMSGAAGEPPGECDVSGRWLVTSHLTTDALGALQFGHYYEYFEIEQHGDAFTITKGFMCGADAVGDGSLAADVDFSGANESLPAKVRYDGRTGTSTKVADGCRVELENWYTVRGVTTPFYLDPANALPTGDQPATDTTPGWEDWDGDGNPGITGVLSGVVSGKIFVGPRVWTAMSGTVTDLSTFRLSVKWGQEQNVLGYDGSPLLGTEAAIGPDPETHFAQFAHLAADQAAGDDLATCAAVIQLAPQLTPEASGS